MGNKSKSLTWLTASNILTLVFGVISAIGVLYAAGYLSPHAPDPDSKEGARLELQHRQLPFTSDGFTRAVVLETPEIVELYLKAGFSPNEYLSGVPFYPLYMAMQNSGNELAVVNVLLKFHPNLNQLNRAKQLYPYPPMTMGQEAVFEAIRRGKSDIARRLIEAGVDAQFFIDTAHFIVCDQMGFGPGQIATMHKAGIDAHACGK